MARCLIAIGIAFLSTSHGWASAPQTQANGVGGLDLRRGQAPAMTPEPSIATLSNSQQESVCGYEWGKFNAFSCSSGAYCSRDTLASQLGCCYTNDPTQVLSCVFHTSCVDIRGTRQLNSLVASPSNCDEQCQSDSNILKCTESASAYCYSVAFENPHLGAFACADAQDYQYARTDQPVVILETTTATPYTINVPSFQMSSSTPQGLAPVTVGLSTTPPFSRSQRAAESTTAQSTSRAVSKGPVSLGMLWVMVGFSVAAFST